MLLLRRTSLSEDGEEAPLFFSPLPPQKGYPDKKVERGWAGEGIGGEGRREVIQRTEKFHFLPCTEKIVSAGKTWRRDGRFTRRTLITICSFPDNNSGKSKKKKKCTSLLRNGKRQSPLSPFLVLFCGGTGVYFIAQHAAAAVLITGSVIIGEERSLPPPPPPLRQLHS